MTEISFALPHVFAPGSSPGENAAVLECMLDALIRVDEIYLHHHACPPLYRAGVVYDRTDVWDPIPALYLRRYGDCKSLTAARVAEIRRAGRMARPFFRYQEKPGRSGFLYHILVLCEGEDGRLAWDDPSRRLGMGADENGPGGQRLRRGAMQPFRQGIEPRLPPLSEWGGALPAAGAQMSFGLRA